MKKETITAIIFGILLGSVFGVFLIIKNKQQQLAKNKTIAPAVKLNQTSKAVTTDTQTLEITEPDDKSIVYKNSIILKGKITKNSIVIIQSPIRDMVFLNETDKFSVDFPLALGENAIRISIYPKDKQLRSQEKEIKIYYFNEQL